MDNMKHRRLQELDRSDFEIVDGEPDIRGWDVRNESGKKIGEVEELIVDAAQKKVRYMIVDLDNNELKLNHRKVLLPIGTAQLHRKDDDVILPGVHATQLRELPDYDLDHLDPDVERRICTTLGRRFDTATNAQAAELPRDFYAHDYYNADNLYKHRLHEASPVNRQRTESEYERGLRLWERRSEGGLLPEDGRRKNVDNRPGTSEDAHLERVRNRRRQYEERKGRSIERRIRDEGLRDG